MNCNECQNFKPKEKRECFTCKHSCINTGEQPCSFAGEECKDDNSKWEPVEPKVERICKTCKHSFLNGKPLCKRDSCLPVNDYKFWEPIEKGVKLCRDCRHWQSLKCGLPSSESCLWEPRPDVVRECKDCDYYLTDRMICDICYNHCNWKPVELKEAPKCEDCRFKKDLSACSKGEGYNTITLRKFHKFCGPLGFWFEPERRKGDRRDQCISKGKC
jgi:hypothetical protein